METLFHDTNVILITLVNYYTVLPLFVCPSVLPFVRASVRPSVRPSNIFFVAFFSVTVDGRNLIFGHKRHIGIPYCG